MSAQVVRDAAGNPIVGSDGKVTPEWIPGSATRIYQFFSNRDAEIELNTQSLYVNDRWQLNDHWSFNVGIRYEEVTGDTQSGINTVDTDALVPRLAASYDVRGDGKYRFDLTYAEYAGKYSESQFAENTDVGNPPALIHLYTGPTGTGYDFAPAYDLSNYFVAVADDGTQNIFNDPDINSPVVEEITLSAGMELARGGFLKAIYTTREYSDFVEDFITTETGTTDVVVEGNPAGTFSNVFLTNSDIPFREYEAVQLIGRYRLTDNWTIDGNWTYQLKNDGNFEGETANSPGDPSVIGDYPETLLANRHFPGGRLNDYQEHKLRVWSNYNLNFGRAGNVNFGLLARFDSGLTESISDSIGFTSEQNAILSSLYVDSPASQTVFFGERGRIEYPSHWRFDLAVNYQVPIAGDFELWLKADVFNLFNDDTVVDRQNGVSADFSGPVDELGIPTTYIEDADFGRTVNNNDFVTPFGYQFTVGFRF